MDSHDYYRKTLKEAKKTNSPLACYEVGRCLERGFGVLINKKSAWSWYERAFKNDGVSVLLNRAIAGEPEAQFVLGRMYDKGQGGLAEDEARAAHWYQKAAEQGYIFAQNNLEWMYANGRGVAKDETLALEWYRKAAEQGDTLAQNNLRQMDERKAPRTCPMCSMPTSKRGGLTLLTDNEPMGFPA